MGTIAPKTWVLDRDRTLSAVFTVLVETLLLYALLAGIRVVSPVPVDQAMKVFTVAAPPPPRPAPPRQAQKQERTKEKEGAASPKNVRSKATEVVAPRRVVHRPPQIEATLKPDFGRISTSGAADERGPGTGSGGIGEGTGSGLGGLGPGGGGLGPRPPRHISGWLRNADYPRAALYAGYEGTVTIIVTIEPNGRVSRCEIYRSSGFAELDETTCRLVQRRYRYRPALDDEGRPVRAREMQKHTWVMEYDRDFEG